MDHKEIWSAQSAARVGQLKREAERKECQQRQEELRYTQRELLIGTENNKYAEVANDIAREANRYAKEANQIARDANRDSKESNKISKLSLFVAALAILVAIFI